MPVSLPEGEVGVSFSFRTISLPFEAIRAEYLSRMQWLRKGRPSCPFCTRYKLAPWPKTNDRMMSDSFTVSRGLRQGCVLSSLLGRCLQHRGGEPEQTKGADAKAGHLVHAAKGNLRRAVRTAHILGRA